MKNSSLCVRFGVETKNAAQATKVINATMKAGLIQAADPEHPGEGYTPCWVS